MNTNEKIKSLGYAVILLGQRLLRLEPSEKYRNWIKQMMAEIQHEVVGICGDKDCKYNAGEKENEGSHNHSNKH